LSYRPNGTNGTRHARLSDARILFAGDLPSRPPFSINPFTQVHGARCLKPYPLIADKARSYTNAQASSPRYPVDQGWARYAPDGSPQFSTATNDWCRPPGGRLLNAVCLWSPA